MTCQIIYDSFNSWHFVDNNSISIDDPHHYKLFHQDIFDVQTKEIYESTVRSSIIPGILIIAGNKTYGRNSSGKLLYKCQPYDPLLPAFLVPYQLPHIGFSKIIPNLYVIIRFFEWIDKHPIGKIHQTIGPIDILEHYFEYHLHCRNIFTSVQLFQKAISQRIKHQKVMTLSDNNDIFTIDSKNTTDFDDAFSISDNTVTIYISNVVFGMDQFELWNVFSNRIATIYYPNNKKPMIPLSHAFCSLKVNEKRSALKMEVTYNAETITHIEFSTATIQVAHNYVYESPELLSTSNYQRLRAVTQRFVVQYPQENCDQIRNSHDVVAYWMIFMNQQCGHKLKEMGGGIFRVSGTPLPVAMKHKIHYNYYHYSMMGGTYAPITSPLRRLVDLLNLIALQLGLGIEISDNALSFYEKWTLQIDFINSTMIQIAKFQSDCRLMQLCFGEHSNVMNESYSGILFHKTVLRDNWFQYMVYLPKLNISCRIRLQEEYEELTERQFRIFLFQHEQTFHKKIRIQ